MLINVIDGRNTSLCFVFLFDARLDTIREANGSVIFQSNISQFNVMQLSFIMTFGRRKSLCRRTNSIDQWKTDRTRFLLLLFARLYKALHRFLIFCIFFVFAEDHFLLLFSKETKQLIRNFEEVSFFGTLSFRPCI